MSAEVRDIEPGLFPDGPPVRDVRGADPHAGLASAGILLALGGASAWHHGNAGPVHALAAAGVACAALQVQRFCAGVFRAYEQFHPENVGRVLQGVLFTALLGLLTWRGGA